MPVKGSAKCVEYLLFWFTLMLWLAGNTVLAIGLWLRFDPQTRNFFREEDSDSSFYKGVYIVIAAGILMTLVGFLGCCGAVLESRCLLGLFFISLVVIFGFGVAAASWGYSHKRKVVKGLQEFYKDAYYKLKSKDEPQRETLRAIHYALQCCGVIGGMEQFISDLCFGKDNIETILVKPCPEAIKEVFYNRFDIVITVGIGIAVVMIFGMIFSTILCCAICRSRRTI